ncbi:hypothetical protein VTL71DRAFT_6279 [Oculimacula yallundae]|uniref:Uncharacterized protein n=1 Tax=Oculimacula yallundae TaxID=86028 RepID=A0ABR4BWL9_9HELO
MRFSIVAAFALCASVVSAEDLNVPSVISQFYTQTSLGIEAKASTSLASALHSVESTWQNSPKFTSAIAAVYSAAPSSASASLTRSFNYADLTAQKWYTKDVPKGAQTDIANYIKAVDSAAAKIVGTPSTSKSGCMPTGAPVMLGAVGVIGGVVMAAM